MTYIVIGLGTIGTAVAMRRDPESGFTAPWGKAIPLIIWPIVILVASTELGFLQNWIDTTSLDGTQWLICIGARARSRCSWSRWTRSFRRRRLRRRVARCAPPTVTRPWPPLALAPRLARMTATDVVP